MNCFVVLHYKNLVDTLECISSIKQISGPKKIIVVDNHSLNEEEEKLLKKNADDLILLNENLGFAKANNIGCKLALEKYKPQFLIVLNNDTLINQKEFLKMIKEDYDKYNFAILGPKIITNNGDSTNPFPVYKTLEEVDKKIKYSEKLIKIYSNAFLTYLLETYVKIKGKIKKQPPPQNGSKRVQNVALHGCALIFSPNYFNNNSDIFDSRTFLFHEEEFLYQRMLKQKFITLYDPKIEIFHKEGKSMDSSHNSNERLKKKFRHKEIVKSLKILKSDLERDDKNER